MWPLLLYLRLCGILMCQRLKYIKKYKIAYKFLYSSPEKKETAHYRNIQILKICTNLIIAN